MCPSSKEIQLFFGSDTVQELGVFELQRDSVVFNSDIVQKLGVFELQRDPVVFR